MHRLCQTRARPQGLARFARRLRRAKGRSEERPSFDGLSIAALVALSSPWTSTSLSGPEGGSSPSKSRWPKAHWGDADMAGKTTKRVV